MGGLFHDEDAWRIVLVADRIDRTFAELAGLRHDSLVDFDARDVLRLAGLLRFDEQAKVGGIGEKPALAGFDGVGEALAREDLVFEHAETAAIEGESTGVVQPECAKRTAG